MRRGRREWRVGVGLLAGVVALAIGCSAPAPAPPSPGGTVPSAGPPREHLPEHLKVAYASTGLSQGYVWVAEDAGYYADEGLEVELQYVPGSNVASQALLAGELQFLAGGGSTSVGAALAGADTVLLATITGTFVISIMGVSDLAPTAESVRGRTMGVTRLGSTSDFVARYWLRRLGLEPVADVPIVQLGGNAEMAAGLATGAAQMVSVTDIFGLELQRQGYRELADMGALGAEYVYSGVITTRPYVAAHEDAVRRYLRATARGLARFITDEAFAVQVVRKYAQLDDPEVLARSWERYSTRYLKRIPYTTSPAVQLALDELALTNPQAKGADPAEFYDNRYVRELEESGYFATLYGQ